MNYINYNINLSNLEYLSPRERKLASYLGEILKFDNQNTIPFNSQIEKNTRIKAENIPGLIDSLSKSLLQKDTATNNYYITMPDTNNELVPVLDKRFEDGTFQYARIDIDTFKSLSALQLEVYAHLVVLANFMKKNPGFTPTWKTQAEKWHMNIDSLKRIVNNELKNKKHLIDYTLDSRSYIKTLTIIDTKAEEPQTENNLPIEPVIDTKAEDRITILEQQLKLLQEQVKTFQEQMKILMEARTVCPVEESTIEPINTPIEDDTDKLLDSIVADTIEEPVIDTPIDTATPATEDDTEEDDMEKLFAFLPSNDKYSEEPTVQASKPEYGKDSLFSLASFETDEDFEQWKKQNEAVVSETRQESQADINHRSREWTSNKKEEVEKKIDEFTKNKQVNELIDYVIDVVNKEGRKLVNSLDERYYGPVIRIIRKYNSRITDPYYKHMA